MGFPNAVHTEFIVQYIDRQTVQRTSPEPLETGR